MDDRWISSVIQTQSTSPDWMRSTYITYFKWHRCSYNQHIGRFKCNAVGVRQLLPTQLLRVIFSKTREYFIVKVTILLYTRFIGCTCFVSFDFFIIITFVIFSRVSLTIVMLIFVFVPTLLLLHTRSYIFVGNFRKIEIHIVSV